MTIYAFSISFHSFCTFCPSLVPTTIFSRCALRHAPHTHCASSIDLHAAQHQYISLCLCISHQYPTYICACVCSAPRKQQLSTRRWSKYAHPMRSHATFRFVPVRYASFPMLTKPICLSSIDSLIIHRYIHLVPLELDVVIEQVAWRLMEGVLYPCVLLSFEECCFRADGREQPR